MAPISHKLDADAVDERHSMLADLVEQEVLRGGKMSRERLATWVKKADAIRLLRSAFRAEDTTESSDGVELDEDDRADGTAPGPMSAAGEAARRVFEQLEERCRCLGSLYPFSLTAGGELQRNGNTSSAAYELLLSMSIAHRYGIEVGGVKVDQVFERIVAMCISQMGFVVEHFGTAAGARGSIVDRVKRAGNSLKLRMDWQGNAEVFRKMANDGGIDTIGRLGAGDERPGDLLLLAQTTVARSADWNKKAGEASFSALRFVFPYYRMVAALAVPYHVAADRLLELSRLCEVIVLDRLRLVRLFGAQLPSESHKLCEAVASVEFEWS